MLKIGMGQRRLELIPGAAPDKAGNDWVPGGVAETGPVGFGTSLDDIDGKAAFVVQCS